MGRKTPYERMKKERLLMILQSLLACVGAIFIAALFFSAIATVLDLSDGTFMLMSSLALCAGCFAAGYTAAKRRKKHGLTTGLACGAVIFAVVFIGGAVCVRSFSAGGFFTKMLIIFICSAIGGIIGVNSPQRFR